ALTMSDRVAVFHDGAIEQIGRPDDLYNRPQSAFVASFIGENNTLNGTVVSVSADRCEVALDGGGQVHAVAVDVDRAGENRQLAIRPERLELRDRPDGHNSFAATIAGRVYLGDHHRLFVTLSNGQELAVNVGPESPSQTGDTVTVSWSPAD